MINVLLRPEASAACDARRAVGDLCVRDDVGAAQREVAVLLTSELVLNAVSHAGGLPVLEAFIRSERLRVAVADRSPFPPRPAWGSPPVGDSGRGLLLVAGLASRWGCTWVSDGRPGKTVWFELDLA